MPIVTPLLSYLQNPDKILPVAAIEVPTTLGRTYQGYKRGGKTEARERICEETLGAAVWLFGVKAFNKIGDAIGKNVLGLKELGTDVGKDSLRRPFDNVTHKKGLTAGFKFGKILGSAILGTVAMGIFVPKLKMAMTNAFRMKEGQEPIPNKNSKDGKFHMGLMDKFVANFIKYDYDPNKNSKPLNPLIPDMDNFMRKIDGKNPLSFKGNAVDFLLYASHNLENNNAWRLLSTDAGTLAGRVANSRNKTEATEYLVRDSISSWFYIFAAPVFSNLVRKISKTSDIHPKAAEETAVLVKKIINDKGQLPVGSLSKTVLSAKQSDELVKDIIFSEDETITLDEFNRQTKDKYKAKAELMSKLQPELKNKDGSLYSILSKKQASDIISDSYTSDPEFLKSAISKVTDGKSDDKFAFVSRKQLEKIRGSFDEYILGLEKYAKKNLPDNSSYTAEFIDKYTKYINTKNLLIHLSGMGFAILGLSFLIPKLQNYITEKTTGSNKFPGTMGYETDTDK